ncbi:hypothetical protein FHS43_001026 [Streptosporangium becharense]|uniref:DUF3068 domain-containing protein n=1 Tax=Streptosporangium becharense TaxID=1816182 RepID=A0A7W9IFQ2_9ACTN|nr:DUF3068 domain-containing protein [Streptosporangium becharense]MBB2909780.1 hypothetical protein [Streptosporangium becharense]MBB5819264.1 hypothetical protein [Streptosporangium becharense]
MRRPRISRVAVLAGVGAFLLTFAALLRFFVYEGVLALPLQHNRTYRLESPVSTFLDTGTLVSYDRVPLVSTTTLSGDAAAGDGNVAVWTEFTTLDTPFGERVAYHERRTAFDRRTGLAVDCCDGYVDDDPGARQTGLAFRLPFRAQPRVYPMYDTVLRRPVPLLFEREEEVRGLRTYRYAYRTGFIKIEDLPGKLPGRLLGLPGTRSVAVARYAQVSRTLWVEPESGLTVRAQEQHRQELRTSDGRGRRVSLRADLVTPASEVAGMVAEARAFTRWVLVVRDALPGFLFAVGLVFLLLAVRPLERLRRTSSTPGPEPDPEPAREPDAEPGPEPDPASTPEPGSGTGADSPPKSETGPEPGSGTVPERAGA